MKVIAIKEHRYAGESRHVGDIYEAKAEFVRTLIALGRVKVMESEPVEPKTQPGRYKRRDLRAEDK